jgi:hypothetical protein
VIRASPFTSAVVGIVTATGFTSRSQPTMPIRSSGIAAGWNPTKSTAGAIAAAPVKRTRKNSVPTSGVVTAPNAPPQPVPYGTFTASFG